MYLLMGMTEPHEAIMFSAAALSITKLYRSSRKTSKRAYNAGYGAACQDLLNFIQQGVSTGDVGNALAGTSHTVDGGGMTIGRVMDWTEARLEAIRATEEEEDEDEEREKDRERGRAAPQPTAARTPTAGGAAPPSKTTSRKSALPRPKDAVCPLYHTLHEVFILLLDSYQPLEATLRTVTSINSTTTFKHSFYLFETLKVTHSAPEFSYSSRTIPWSRNSQC